MATSGEVMQQLEAWGTEQNRKTYTRHGASPPMFGVSFANMGTLKKKIKVDHALALDLWKTGNHDARILALMIADPAQTDLAQLETWMKDIDNYVLSDALAAYIATTPIARQVAEDWIERDGEWVEATGWVILGSLAHRDADMPDSYYEAYLPRIEREIHSAKNRVRHSMNGAVIAIGGRNTATADKAIAAAQRIGKVVVDHGQTDCKTPEAVGYIQKILARKNKN